MEERTESNIKEGFGDVVAGIVAVGPRVGVHDVNAQLTVEREELTYVATKQGTQAKAGRIAFRARAHHRAETNIGHEEETAASGWGTGRLRLNCGWRRKCGRWCVALLWVCLLLRISLLWVCFLLLRVPLLWVSLLLLRISLLWVCFLLLRISLLWVCLLLRVARGTRLRRRLLIPGLRSWVLRSLCLGNTGRENAG